MAKKMSRREAEEAIAYRLTDLALKEVTLDEAKKIRERVAKEQEEAVKSGAAKSGPVEKA